MNKVIAIILLWSIYFTVNGQSLYPVKLDGQWGLINGEGELVVEAQYNAIGSFHEYGYAVMQRNGGVGLLNNKGEEIVAPLYQDVKILDVSLMAVLNKGEWQVIDLNGNVILGKGYEKVEIWDSQYVAFKRGGLWGIVDINGNEISAPKYESVFYEDRAFFLTRSRNKIGVLALDGQEVLPNVAKELKVLQDSLYFYKVDNYWGAVDEKGRALIQPKYESFKKIGEGFVSLTEKGKARLFSIPCKRMIASFSQMKFLPFSKKYVLIKKDNHLGLINWCGNLVLAPEYNEIQLFDDSSFRVRIDERWGVVDEENTVILPFEYTYIAPMVDGVAALKKDSLFAVVNKKGKQIVDFKYKQIKIHNKKINAYGELNGEETMEQFSINDEGEIVENEAFVNHFQVRVKTKNTLEEKKRGIFKLENYEWFFDAKADRWGLRDLATGDIQIEPTFDYVNVEADLGFTVVGIWKNNEYDFERTTFRFEMVLGLVNNDEGLLITALDFVDIKFDDFRQGSQYARCILTNGKYSLLDKMGRRDSRSFTYIGEFNNGIAPMSAFGKITGSVKTEEENIGYVRNYLDDMLCPSYMLDYTKYDELFFQKAKVICEDCNWGYIDTTAKVVVIPQYSFAKKAEKGTAMVKCGDKWGLINIKGENVVPCSYDGIEYLENTNKEIVRLYVKEPKYGLIDTLGQLRVSALYNEIGLFAENRLAVKRYNYWGFVNAEGQEVISCRFKKVRPFVNGYAAVQLGNYWGLIDKMGNIVLDFKYRGIGDFYDGLIWVDNGIDISYVDAQGKVLIDGKYEKAFNFQNGIARVVVGVDYGLINTKGEFILKPKYSLISDFNEYDLAIVRIAKKQRVSYGVINRQGKLITNSEYTKIERFSEGMAVVKEKSTYGYIDTTGRLVVSCKYTKAAPFKQGLAAVTYKGHCGYITMEGDKKVDYEFSRCEDFDGGRAVVYKGIKKAGLIDLDGSYIIKPGVDRLLGFKGGKGLVRDNKYRFYYITENPTIKNQYYEKARTYDHGVAVVQMGGKWGIIDQSGITIIPPKYDAISPFENGYAKVLIDGFTGLADVSGREIAHPDFEFISYAGNGLFRAEKEDKVGYLDRQGSWVWKLKK